MVTKIGIPFDFRIQPELHTKLKEFAKSKNVAMADVARTAIKDLIENEVKVDGTKMV